MGQPDQQTPDRYMRHALIDWFSQEQVRAYRFAVVGCGAIGNELAKNLALLGLGFIDLYDFDVIESHNLTRSVLFRESDVGKSKVEVAARRIEELDPNVAVRTFHGDFWGHMSFELATSYDCVFACVDNFEARLRLNQICLITSTNFVNVAIDSKFCSVEFFPFRHSEKTACYECNLPHSVYQRMQDRYSCGWLKKISFIEKKIPTTVITSSISAAFAISQALNFLRNGDTTSQKWLFDTFTGSSTRTDLGQNPDCPQCEAEPKTRVFLKAPRAVRSNKSIADTPRDLYVSTSEPILVQYFCKECEPELQQRNTVFQKAADFNSTLVKCKKCERETVVTDIRDRFSVRELLAEHALKNMPCKFVKFETSSLITYVEMEN